MSSNTGTAGLLAIDPATPLLCSVIASVLSKKVAAGSTHVLLDLPIGPTAKVRTAGDAVELSRYIEQVSGELGLNVRIVQTDGSQPVGRGIGPALEARDVLAVLRAEPTAPPDLRDRAVLLAGALLELGGAAAPGLGQRLADAILSDGRALRKFLRICEAQGGFHEPPVAELRHEIGTSAGGRVSAIDNRLLARIAKLAGAPAAQAAGLELHVKIGDRVQRGQPLITLHAETRGEMAYALAFARANPHTIAISDS